MQSPTNKLLPSGLNYCMLIPSGLYVMMLAVENINYSR